MTLSAGRRINAYELRIRWMNNTQRVNGRDYRRDAKFDRMRGKARRATDASVILGICMSDRGPAHIVTGACGEEAGRARCAHRGQRITDIEREIVRGSTEKNHQSDKTKSRAAHRRFSLSTVR